MRAWIIAVIILSATLGGLLYLTGSAAAASWNIATWDPFGRVLAAGFWFIGTLSMCVVAAQLRADEVRRPDL